MLEDLARMILDAQRIREESWNGSGYDLTTAKAASKAGETSALDLRANRLVYLIMVCGWIEEWAENCLAEKRYESPCDDCVFLGAWEEYDLYICNKKRIVISPENGHFSAVTIDRWDLAESPKAAWHATALAKQQGYIK